MSCYRLLQQVTMSYKALQKLGMDTTLKVVKVDEYYF